MIKEESFVRDLSCDELCVISKKKSYDKKLKSNKIAKLARSEMNQKMCYPC